MLNVEFVISGVITVLFSVVAIFFKVLLGKLDEGNRLLRELDKHVAVLSSRLEDFNGRLMVTEKQVKSNTDEILRLRDRLHDGINKVPAVVKEYVELFIEDKK